MKMSVKVKVTGVVKYAGRWRYPGDVLEDVRDEIAQQLVEQDVGEIVSEEETKAKPASKNAKSSEGDK
ncbi:MAG: hypothetical protein C6P35_03240 [Cohnella sp.]|nr:MAG: hypothetical protein C6P35_03240 [Cohnella sp.]